MMKMDQARLGWSSTFVAGKEYFIGRKHNLYIRLKQKNNVTFLKIMVNEKSPLGELTYGYPLSL